ncbi:MAG: site-specific integrase [Nitrospirota bacterium]|nr:site-specific integrase [Nitrospirota bacterium]
MRWGIRLQLCKIDPTSGVRRFPVSSRARFLTTEEISRLLSALHAAAENIRLFVLLVLATGCRRGEARNMKWCDVDLVNRRWTKPRTKSGQWHMVPLPHQIVHAMKHYPRTNQWVFSGQDGKAWSLSGIEKAWGKFRSTCNLQDTRIHDLRRTAASHLAINGENLTTIQKMLDHSSLQATAIYARLNLDALDGALQRNADRFFSASTEAGC